MGVDHAVDCLSVVLINPHERDLALSLTLTLSPLYNRVSSQTLSSRDDKQETGICGLADEEEEAEGTGWPAGRTATMQNTAHRKSPLTVLANSLFTSGSENHAVSTCSTTRPSLSARPPSLLLCAVTLRQRGPPTPAPSHTNTRCANDGTLLAQERISIPWCDDRLMRERMPSSSPLAYPIPAPSAPWSLGLRH